MILLHDIGKAVRLYITSSSAEIPVVGFAVGEDVGCATG